MRKIICLLLCGASLFGCNHAEKTVLQVPTVREMVKNPEKIKTDMQWCLNDPSNRASSALCVNADKANSMYRTMVEFSKCNQKGTVDSVCAEKYFDEKLGK